MSTKYKGKNIRVSEESHQRLSTELPKKTIIGAWVDEAIAEKFAREKEQENVVLQRYGKQIETK